MSVLPPPNLGIAIDTLNLESSTVFPSDPSSSTSRPRKSSKRSNGPYNKSRNSFLEGDEAMEEEPVKFVLLAEFDIDQGATLTHQYPFPTGTDEHTLAELMLPDGAHLRSEDWTIFYLNQTRRNAVAPVLTSDSPASGGARFDEPRTRTNTTDSTASIGGLEKGREDLGELLFVLNCVRMKEDKTVRRGAMVKALAICTTKPYIQIYKPLLLLALEEYYQSPSPQVLAKLFDSLNSISLAGCPNLSRAERIILRNSESKDLFGEKFVLGEPDTRDDSGGVEDLGIDDEEADEVPFTASSSGGGGVRKSLRSTFGRLSDGSVRRMRKTSRTSLKAGGSTVLPSTNAPTSNSTNPPSNVTSSQQKGLGLGRPGTAEGDLLERKKPAGPRDTHFYDTTAEYSGLSIPIRVPLSIFPEEVGDYSIIQLVQTFTPMTPVPFAPPFHPQLHTAGAFTHPIILLLNALLTQKRIIFLGHGQPAGHVANFVLAACALASPVLRGFTERAFPYSNLAGLEMLEEVPGYIAGVTNPRFEDLYQTWDVLFNLETGKVTISKALVVVDTNKDELSMKSPTSADGSSLNTAHETESHTGHGAAGQSIKDMKSYNPDTMDNIFMEEVMAAIQAHYGEPAIRARFTEYMTRFVRMSARYEEEFYGHTSIGYPLQPYREGSLGSGFMFADEPTKSREWAVNASRIEGWRKTRSYRYWREDFHEWLDSAYAVPGLDVQHQISRLKHAKAMPESEAALIYTTLAEKTHNYSRITELLSQLPHHAGGLTPLALGLFHKEYEARAGVIQLIDRMQQYPIGCAFTSKLNVFQRLTYQRLADEELAIRR